jgi:spermidine/putrescine ABC transporter ATP-binding subunit
LGAMSEPVLRLANLEKRFGAAVAVAGPSGCGKTTLLRMLAGFEVPDAGRILLEGKDISALPPEKRPLNLMFQSYALFPHMTVRRNLAYGLEMEKLPRAEIASRVEAIMATTDLSALAERKPDQLSGGQRQRVALARALVKRPKVLLLDEPLGALDKKLRERMQLELKRMQHEVGITFIMVTHDQEEALVMADRMAVLRDGHVVQTGTPEDIYERPADPFVANFIGIMNHIDGEAGSDGWFRAAELALPVRAGFAGKARLAFRPENVRLEPEGDGLPGRILDVAYHGLDRMVRVATSAAPKPLQVRVAIHGPYRPSIGDSVVVRIPAEHVRLFRSNQ